VYATASRIVIEESRILDCDAREGGGFLGYNVDASLVESEFIGNDAWSAGGIGAVGPQITIVRCNVSENRALTSGDAGGIGCVSPMLAIRECIVTRNSCYDYGMAEGILIQSSTGVIDACTVARNFSSHSSGAIWIVESEIEVRNTIIASNSGRAFTDCWYSQVSVGCSDLFGNTESDDPCGDDLGGNFSGDPLFCDPANGDYTLDWASPCLPGNHPDGVDCGLIGARDAGCGTLPTGACCFADGSCLVLGESTCGEQGGNYMGNGTTCDPNPCEPVPIQSTTWGRIKASYR
jgi:hypothetical protein